MDRPYLLYSDSELQMVSNRGACVQFCKTLLLQNTKLKIRGGTTCERVHPQPRDLEVTWVKMVSQTHLTPALSTGPYLEIG